MRTRRFLLIAPAVMCLLALACRFTPFEWFAWNIAGPQAPVDLLGTQTSPEYVEPDCTVPLDSITIEYINLEIDSYESAFKSCNADLVLTNVGPDSLYAVYAYDYDNYASRNTVWKVAALPVDGQATIHVNETITSTVTYLRVTRLLLVKYSSACEDQLMQEGMQARWEQLAAEIEPFKCP